MKIVITGNEAIQHSVKPRVLLFYWCLKNLYDDMRNYESHVMPYFRINETSITEQFIINRPILKSEVKWYKM